MFMVRIIFISGVFIYTVWLFGSPNKEDFYFLAFLSAIYLVAIITWYDLKEIKELLKNGKL